MILKNFKGEVAALCRAKTSTGVLFRSVSQTQYSFQNLLLTLLFVWKPILLDLDFLKLSC